MRISDQQSDQQLMSVLFIYFYNNKKRAYLMANTYVSGEQKHQIFIIE